MKSCEKAGHARPSTSVAKTIDVVPSGKVMTIGTPDFVLTVSCADRIGIVHSVSGFLVQYGCNILDSAQFSDRSTGTFFMRVSFSARPSVSLAGLKTGFAVVAGEFGMA